MKVLLDTNVLAWTLLDAAYLSAQAREVLRASGNEKLVSAVSCWEIATKVRLGKWKDAAKIEANLLEGIRLAGFHLLAIDGQIAMRAGRLPGPHRDPFDRMIAAHALQLDCPVLSSDRELETFGVQRIW